MKSHHFLKEVNQRLECLYCRNDLTENRWYSSFNLEHHYKVTECKKCGRTMSIKLTHHGSGHDCWDKNSGFCNLITVPTAKSPLEEKIKENK